jgi:hypothetical protein
METLDRPSKPRIIVAALIAPFVAPVLSIILSWLFMNVGSDKQELQRWIRFEDLWPLHLLVLGVACIGTWCIGWPFYRLARSKSAASTYGMCVTGALIGLVIPLPFAIASGSLGGGVVAGALFAGCGVVIAMVFSVIAGLPRDVSQSILLQRDK